MLCSRSVLQQLFGIWVRVRFSSTFVYMCGCVFCPSMLELYLYAVGMCVFPFLFSCNLPSSKLNPKPSLRGCNHVQTISNVSCKIPTNCEELKHYLALKVMTVAEKWIPKCLKIRKTCIELAPIVDTNAVISLTRALPPKRKHSDTGDNACGVCFILFLKCVFSMGTVTNVSGM